MKRLQPQNLRLNALANGDVEKIDPLKALKNPAHGGTIGWFVHLVRNGL